MIFRKGLTFLIVISFVALMAACSDETEDTGMEGEETGLETIALPQLTGEVDAATMVLVSAPPTQPADHIDRWIPEQQEGSCMTCHGFEGTGAPSIPDDHFYDSDREQPIFRTYCIQCHGETNDDKPAFNREN